MELLTSKQTAEYLKLSYSRFMSLLSTEPHLLPPYIKIGGSYRWSKELIDKWANENLSRDPTQHKEDLNVD